MAGRFIAQIVVVAGQVVVRAFSQAYREAVARGGKAAADSGAQKATTAASSWTRSRMMDLEEARKVLNVDKSTPWENVEKNYDHLFKVNSKDNGGSFYLQSKVYRAKERLEFERQSEASPPHPKQDEPPPPPPPPTS